MFNWGSPGKTKHSGVEAWSSSERPDLLISGSHLVVVAFAFVRRGAAWPCDMMDNPRINEHSKYRYVSCGVPVMEKYMFARKPLS